MRQKLNCPSSCPSHIQARNSGSSLLLMIILLLSHVSTRLTYVTARCRSINSITYCSKFLRGLLQANLQASQEQSCQSSNQHVTTFKSLPWLRTHCMTRPARPSPPLPVQQQLVPEAPLSASALLSVPCTCQALSPQGLCTCCSLCLVRFPLPSSPS